MSKPALYDPRNSVAVSSSAGSGKTYTLTTRLLAMLLSGVELSQVLAITFTNAAANDIREELFSRIDELEAGNASERTLFTSILSLNEKQLRQRAGELRLKLIRQFSLLQISTIHSFFTRIIGCFPRQTGIVDFAIIDEPDREVLLQESFVRFFDQLHKNRAFTDRMVTLLTSRDEKGLKVAVKFRDIYDLVHNRYFMLESLTQALDEHIDSVEREFFKNRAFLLSQNYARVIDSLASVIDAYLKAFGDKKNPRSFVRKLEDFLQSGTIRILTDCYPFKDYRGANLKNYLQRIAHSLPDKEGFIGLFHDAWRALSNFHMSEMRYRIYSWLDVYVLVQNIYASLKKASHVIDYADIELIARDFLTGLSDYGFFRSRLETGIRYILIDEFQDTSELQWDALRPLIQNCVKGGGALFYVGDVKQSIYRWRGGEPYLFHRALSEFGIQEERLPYSYRQNRILLDFVNDVFKSFSEETEGRFLYAEQQLPPHVTDKERGFVSIRGMGGEEEVLAEILELILGLEKEGVAADDVAILCRTNREVGTIEALLRNERIVFNSAGKTRLLDDYCIRDILNVIGFVLHEKEPLYLAGLLRAPFFGCNYDSLEKLTGTEKGSAMSLLRTLDMQLWERVQRVLRLSRYTTPSGFIMDLYRELDMFAVYPDKRAPLMAFLELAYSFEASRESSRTRDFYRYLYDNVERLTLSAGDHGGITVQTIHSAKGLEYHTVILPFLKQRYHAKLDGSLMYSRDAEGNIDYLAIASRVYVQYYTDQDEISRLQQENDRDYQTDEINTLYVALTRARENLIILPQMDIKSESVGTKLMNIVCADCNAEADAGIRMGELVPSSGESEKRAKEYIETFPAEKPLEQKGEARTDEEQTLPGVRRMNRREGLLRGILFHAVIERIMELPIGSDDLNRLFAAAAAREGRGYTKDELAAALDDVRPMIMSVVSDPDLKKYFSRKAAAELSIFSKKYQNLIGRIDRIYLGDVIEVLDFKTNPIQDDAELKRLTESYGEQVAAYCSVIAEIFPDRMIRGYLYFTGAAESRRLVEVGGCT
jgi:ATP-dependent exoDNAse (exonuclease V) beta subunit